MRGLSRVFGTALLVLGAAGCTMAGPVTPAPAPPPQAVTPEGPVSANPSTGKCDPRAGNWAIGRPVSDSLVERVRAASGASVARVLRPGQMVTMEFQADRLNVRVNGRNNIVNLTCG